MLTPKKRVIMRLLQIFIGCVFLSGCSAVNLPGVNPGVAVYSPTVGVTTSPIEQAFGPTFHSLEGDYPHYQFN